ESLMKRFGLVLLVLSVCLAPVRGQSADEKKATVAYVQGLQAESGGFVPFKNPPGSDARDPLPSVRATSSALRALKYMGGAPKDAKAAVKFVEGCYDKASGGFADMPGGKPDVFTTSIGIMAAVELKMP